MATAMELIASANETLAAHSALITRVRNAQKSHRRQLRALPSPPYELLRLPLIPTPPRSPEPSPPSSPVVAPTAPRNRPELPPAKRARVARYDNYVPEEETIRNDYSQRYVDGGEWPQNWVLGAEPERRFEELSAYPKQRRLLALKKASVDNHTTTPTFLHASDIGELAPTKFDVVLLDPPFSSAFTWDTLEALPVPALAADPSFVFLWVGSGAGEGLERGREVLAKWGYRRCEDVVWVKTNKAANKGPGTDPPTTSLLMRTKQHCLVGIRGTVRRSTDSWFVHCNVDTDVIIWEGDPADPTRKPPEMHTLIENFCLGARRLELFGRASSVRRGWVTALAAGEDARFAAAGVAVLPEKTGAGEGDGDGEYEEEQGVATVVVDAEGRERVELRRAAPSEDGGVRARRWDRARWEAEIAQLAGAGKAVVPTTAEIDALRPKSPVRGGHGGGGGGGHGGHGGSGNVNHGAPTPAQQMMRMGPRHTHGPVPGMMMGPGMMPNMGGMQGMQGMGGGMGMQGMGMGMGMGADPGMGMMWGQGGMGGMGGMGAGMGMGAGGMGVMNGGGMGVMNGGGMGAQAFGGMPQMGFVGMQGTPQGNGMWDGGMGNMGMGMAPQGMGMAQQGMGMAQQGMGMAQQGMGMGHQGMGMGQPGMGNMGMGQGQWGGGYGQY